MTTNTPFETIEIESVETVPAVDTVPQSGIAKFTGKFILMAAALLSSANPAEARQARPGTNQPKAPAVVQPKQSPAPTTPAFKPTLAHPTAPKAVTPATKTPVKPSTPVKPGTSVVPGAKVAPVTLGTAQVAAPRVVRRAPPPPVSVLKQLGDSFYQTIAAELDEVALTNPSDVQAIKEALACLQVERDAKKVDDFYGALNELMSHSEDFNSPSKLRRPFVPKVAARVRVIMATDQ